VITPVILATLVITPVILAITCDRECDFSDLVIEDVILAILDFSHELLWNLRRHQFLHNILKMPDSGLLQSVPELAQLFMVIW
jgi:hypothetical protein